jgi:hypothetical protein
MSTPKPRLIKADYAEADSQMMRAEIVALRASFQGLRRMLLEGVKQIEQMDERAARLEERLARE